MKEVINQRYMPYDISHKTKWIQACGEMHEHRMKPVLSHSSVQEVYLHKLITENNRRRNATTATAA
jgi:hypothetical protein